MMDARDQQMLDANWDRMRRAITSAAEEYRRTADAMGRITFDDHKGQRRSPDAIINELSYAANVGPHYVELIHRLAMWAESINEIETHAASAGPARCTYTIDDPYTTCVLTAGHTLPFDGGEHHVSADGVMFR